VEISYKQRCVLDSARHAFAQSPENLAFRHSPEGEPRSHTVRLSELSKNKRIVPLDSRE